MSWMLLSAHITAKCLCRGYFIIWPVTHISCLDAVCKFPSIQFFLIKDVTEDLFPQTPVEKSTHEVSFLLKNNNKKKKRCQSERYEKKEKKKQFYSCEKSFFCFFYHWVALITLISLGNYRKHEWVQCFTLCSVTTLINVLVFWVVFFFVCFFFAMAADRLLIVCLY